MGQCNQPILMMKTQLLICFLNLLMVAFCASPNEETSANQSTMDTTLHAKLQFRSSEEYWADLTIINNQREQVKVIKPDNFTPFDGWKHSHEAYQIATLQSFHILKITLVDENNTLLSQKTGLSTPLDHAVLYIDFSPGQELNLPIPLHEYYDLEFGKSYTLSVQYGRESIKAQASGTLRIK